MFEEAATHLPKALLPVPYLVAKAAASAFAAPLQVAAADVSAAASLVAACFTCAETHFPNAFAPAPLPDEEPLLVPYFFVNAAGSAVRSALQVFAALVTSACAVLLCFATHLP